jgi:RHS repeat-associated protein
VSDTYAITPYGESVAHTGPTANPFTFQGAFGAMQEGSTSLFYMRARYYDSASARFLSRDPEPNADPGALDPYQFAYGDPVQRIDPSGRDAGGPPQVMQNGHCYIWVDLQTGERASDVVAGTIQAAAAGGRSVAGYDSRDGNHAYGNGHNYFRQEVPCGPSPGHICSASLNTVRAVTSAVLLARSEGHEKTVESHVKAVEQPEGNYYISWLWGVPVMMPYSPAPSH